MKRFSPRLAGALAVFATGSGLGVALGAEWFLGLVPCALCLWERWPYRLSVLLALLAVFLPSEPGLVLLAVVGLVMLGGAGIAAVHVGVEWGLWPSPLPECAAPRLGAGSIAERLAAMPTHPAKPCDDPSFLIPNLPVSMAEMNFLYALLISLLLAIYVGRRLKEQQ
jgi:disulfide bond formation protein DsbB